MTRSASQRARKSLLVGGGALLVLLAVVLLILLRSPGREARTGGAASGSTAPAVADGRPQRAAPSSRTPPPLASGPRIVPQPSSGPAASGGDAPPSVVHVSAPAAIPSEIENERDPARRAELLKMHKLAMARVRVSMLRHRAHVLRAALEKGKRDGSWSVEKMRGAEDDLRQLTTGIAGAEKDLEKVRAEVGGDIDR